MTDRNPFDFTHQVVVHQLLHAAEEIEEGDGLVADFEYDEELEVDQIAKRTVSKQRIVTLELSMILPE